jgi:hypothetical protein
MLHLSIVLGVYLILLYLHKGLTSTLPHLELRHLLFFLPVCLAKFLVICNSGLVSHFKYKLRIFDKVILAKRAYL